jgi:hypothetical protein
MLMVLNGGDVKMTEEQKIEIMKLDNLRKKYGVQTDLQLLTAILNERIIQLELTLVE